MFSQIYEETEHKMRRTVELLAAELSKIRTGRANPAILEGLKVEYYGAQVPLRQIAAITAPEPRLLVVQPWDKSVISEIERAILKSDLGLNPLSDGNLLRIPIPLLTEERRRDLVRLASRLTEEAKVAIRNLRREANERIKRLERDKELSEDDALAAQHRIQDLTDQYISELDLILARKEKELLEE